MFTRVMSPTRADPGSNVGLLMDVRAQCPQCGNIVVEPITCSGCGQYGHPQCLRIEGFCGLPFCHRCLRQVILDYGVQEDPASRAEWRTYYVQQLQRWKSIAMMTRISI